MVIRCLPDPPGRIFDSDKVNAFAEGLRADAVLASAGGTRKAGRHAVFDLLLGGAVVTGAPDVLMLGVEV